MDSCLGDVHRGLVGVARVKHLLSRDAQHGENDKRRVEFHLGRMHHTSAPLAVASCRCPNVGSVAACLALRVAPSVAHTETMHSLSNS